jgi:resuscitation-promoting factor RpfB
MRLNSGFKEHFDRAHRLSRVHIYKRPYLVPIIGIAFGIIVVLGLTVLRGGATLRPSNSHVVFLFDGGKKQTLDTQVRTVGDLINRLPLHLIGQDVVEPSLDTPIVQDNFRINVYRARPVTVIDNGVKTVTVTAQKSPRVVASTAGVIVYPEDQASFAAGDIRNNTIGEEVVIDRATPITFNLYGTTVQIRTRATTVADLLKEKSVTLTKDDTLTPALDTPIAPNMVVSVVRNGTQVTTVQEPITPPVQYVDDSSLSLGATAVRQAGAAGKKAVTYQVVTENGQVTSKTVIQTTVIQDAVPEIIARGTVVYVNGDHGSLMAAAGISGGDYGYVDYIVSHESGWCYTKWQGESGYCPAYHGYPTAGYLGYGLCQSTPATKMASAGDDWATNPITQLRWCSGYALSAYGSWAGAYSHWVAYHWW